MNEFNDYNTDLKGLLRSAKQHNATVFTGKGTLTTINNVVGDYGDFITLINRVIEDVPSEITQTAHDRINHTMDKLVNLWALQQDLLKGNKIKDFIVINYCVKNNRRHFDIHPGRTRMFFQNVYLEPVPVLFIDYSNNITEGGIFNLKILTEDTCDNFPDFEYRLRDNTTQIQLPVPHLLVQPNKNEAWHWPSLEHNLTFRLIYKDDALTHITANGESFINYEDSVWKINTSIN